MATETYSMGELFFNKRESPEIQSNCKHCTVLHRTYIECHTCLEYCSRHRYITRAHLKKKNLVSNIINN